jgi:hypothetical protein
MQNHREIKYISRKKQSILKNNITYEDGKEPPI